MWERGEMRRTEKNKRDGKKMREKDGKRERERVGEEGDG